MASSWLAFALDDDFADVMVDAGRWAPLGPEVVHFPGNPEIRIGQLQEILLHQSDPLSDFVLVGQDRRQELIDLLLQIFDRYDLVVFRHFRFQGSETFGRDFRLPASGDLVGRPCSRRTVSVAELFDLVAFIVT